MLRVITSKKIIPFYFILELIFGYFFIDEYGFFTYILEIFLTGFIGLAIIFNFGFTNFTNKIKVITPNMIFSKFGIIVGGFMIFLPGIFTDTLGIILILISLFYNFKNRNMYKNTQNNTYNYTQNKDDDIIDVEVIDEGR